MAKMMLSVVTMMFASQMKFCRRQSYGVSLGRNGFETRNDTQVVPCIVLKCFAGKKLWTGGFGWARYLLSKRDINSLQN